MEKNRLRRGRNPRFQSHFIKRLSSWLALSTTLTVVLGEALTRDSEAATYTWQIDAATSNWNVDGNWASPGFPNAIDDIANLTNNITANQAVSLNQSITVGTLNIGDPNGSNTFTLAAGTGGYLFMDVSSGTAGITKSAGANANDTISTGIQFNNGLVITNNSTGSLTLSGGMKSSFLDVTFGGTGNVTVSTAGIATSGSLVKNDGGTVTLSIANTYAGTTTINGGTLALNIAAALPARSAVTVAAGATLDYLNLANSIGSLSGAGDVKASTAAAARILTIGADNTSTTFSGRFVAPSNATFMAITKIGAGTLTLAPTAASTYTGATTLNGGTLLLDFSAGNLTSMLAATPVTIGGGNLQIKGRNSGAAIDQTVGALTVGATGGAIIMDPNGSALGTRLTTGVVTATAAGGALLINAPANTTVRLGTALNATTSIGRIVFTDGTTYNWATNAGATTNTTAFGTYADVGGGNPSGTDTNNSRITSANVNEATAPAGNWTTNSLLINAGASGQTLSLGSNNLTLTNGGLLFTGSNDYSITGTGALNSASGANSDVIIQHYGTGNLTIAAPIGAGTGAQTLTKAGTGLVTLTGTNVFTGAVFVDGGTLSFSSVTGGTAGGLGSSTGTTAITIRDGAILQYTGATGTIVSTGAGSHTYSLTGGNATVEVTTAATSLELNGVISGAGGLTKIGPGTLRLNASNTYTGVTTISAGTVQATGSNSIPDLSPVFIDTTGKLDINGTAATQTENIGSLSGSGTVLNSGANTKTFGVGGDNTSTTFSGTFAAGGVAGNILTKSGTGILTLNGATTSAWTGGNNFNSGVVRLAASNVLSATGTTNMNLAAGPSMLELTDGVAQTLGALNFYGTGATATSQATVLLDNGAVLTTGNVSLSATGSGLAATISGAGSLSVGTATRTYTINDSTSVPSTLPELTISVPIISVGAAGILKVGAGNLLLLGNSTYTGATTVNAGQVTVSGAVGSISASPTIAVGDNSGAGDTLIIGAAGDAWAGGASGRLNDTAAITLAGGARFTYAGPASGFTTETVGAITASFGSNTLTLVPGTGSEVILAADSLVRTNTGVLLVRGNNLGTGGVGNTRLSLTTAPSGASFVGGGGAAGATNISIVPWLVGDLSATGAGSSFVTYDTVQGSLRALANAEYVATISGAAAQDNVSLSAADTVGSATTINALRIASGGSSTLNAATTVTSGAVLFTDNETLGGSGSLAFGTVQGILTAAANTTAISGTINATITGSAGIVVNSLGDVANTITLGGSNTFTGGVIIGSGILRIGSSGALNSTTPNVVNLSATNSVLELNGINVTLSNLVGVAGSIIRNSTSAATTATLTVASSASTTFTGSIANGNAGAILNLIKTGTGSFTLSGTSVVASSYTGSMDIQAGALILGGTPGGQLTGTTLVSIQGAGILRLSNSDSNNNSGARLNDGALVNMYGGTFDYDNNATSGQGYSETIGAVSLAAGANVITADRASVSGVNNTTLTITSLARAAGSGSTLELTSQSNNTAVFDLGLAARSRVVINGTVPNDDGIIPFAVTRGAGAVVGNLNPYEFVKYVASGTISATALVDADYALNTGTASWTSAQNIKLTTSNSLSLSTDTQINSINFQTIAATTLDLGSSTLRVESGGILASQNNATSLAHTINNGTLTAGTGPDSSGELIFQIFNIGANTTTLTVNSTVADNGVGAVTLTKAGSGTLKLGNAANTYSGQTSINAGALQIVADGSLGIVPSVTTPNFLRLNGGTLQTQATFELDSHRGIGLSAAGGTISVDPTFTTTYNGIIADNSPTGAPGKLTKAGNGVLILGNTANTYSGGTTISLGTLDFAALGNLGTGGIVMGGGELEWATGNTVDISTRAVTFTAAAIFDTNGNNVTLNNSIGATAAFGITKNGAGTLYVKGTNAFTGATTINAGVVKIDAENNLGTATNDVTFTGAGTLEVTTGFNANAGKVFAFGVNAGTIQVDAGTLKIASAVTVGTAGTFIKSGPGTVALSVGSTAIDGAVRLDAGVLSIDAGVASIIGDSTTARAAVHFNGGSLSYDNDIATAQSFNTFLDADSSTIVLNRVTAGAGVINVLTAPTMTVSAGNAKTLNILGGSNINAGTTEGLPLGAITLNAPITFNISNPTGATTALTIGAITTSAANTITLTGGGTFSQTAVMGGAGGTLTLDSNFTGTANLSQANTFSGGLFVKSGTAAGTTSNTAFGTGPITLGDSAANPNAVTLTGFIASAIVANAIVLNSGTTGTITLAATNNTTAFAYSGGVTGSNSVTLAANVSQALNFTTNPINITGTITNAGAGTGTVTVSGGVGPLVSGITQNSATSSLVLSGANNFGGPISVLAGTLSTTGALNAPGSITGITVNGGGTLNFVNGAGNPLTALTSLGLGSGSGIATLGLELGSASDTLTLTGTATTANSVQFNLTGLAGLTAGTYNLITATSGLSGATYSINSIAGIFGYTLSLTASDTLVQLSLTPASGNFFWRGSINNSWAAVSGANTNFTSDLAGTVNANGTPGTASTVIFSATSATGPAISTTLDGNLAINDLKFTSNPGGVTSVTIAPGTPSTNTLTIAPAAGMDGIDVADNAGAVTISAKVVLGADQTWTVAGTGANGSSLLASGGITGVAGADLTKEGDGTLTVSGTSTYAGATTVNDGVLLAGAANAFSPNSAYTIGASGTLRLNGLANAIGSLFGSGIVQNNHASAAATLTVGAGNFSGTLQNGGAAALAVTKNTTGTLTLAGDSTYTGNTTVSAGTLNVTGSITGNTTASLLAYGGTAGGHRRECERRHDAVCHHGRKCLGQRRRLQPDRRDRDRLVRNRQQPVRGQGRGVVWLLQFDRWHLQGDQPVRCQRFLQSGQCTQPRHFFGGCPVYRRHGFPR